METDLLAADSEETDIFYFSWPLTLQLASLFPVKTTASPVWPIPKTFKHASIFFQFLSWWEATS